MTSRESRADTRSHAVWLAVAFLVLLSFAIRFALLQSAVASGTFHAVDADNYLRNGRVLAQYGAGWQWTLQAIEYPWDGRTYLLPPLYPVFLSVFVRLFDAYEYWAAVGQLALNAASVAGLYVIGASLHSRRAGLIAAGLYAVWLPSIWRFSLFIQEQLYLPLLIAGFAALLWATTTNARAGWFVTSGAIFGLAALTRSMPMYFVIPAALGYALLTRERVASWSMGSFLAGFVLVTGAYSVWLSLQVGQFVYIENHAGISIQMYGGTAAQGVPGFGQIVRQLYEAFSAHPGGFLSIWLGYALALFHLHVDRWLHAYMASTADLAAMVRALALFGIALPFALTVVLAPIGAVLARRSREAALLVLWVIMVVCLTALSAAGGVRYRMPFEPQLIALAAVALAGGWRWPSRPALVAGLCVTLIGAWVVLVQVPRVVRTRANYGLTAWAGPEVSWSTSSTGASGFNLLPSGGALRVLIHRPDTLPSDVSIHVSIRIDGHPMVERLLESGPLRVHLPARHRGLHYVEVHTRNSDGSAVPAGIEVTR